jgi:NifU-like protein involved in Fe-S cluster formation
MTDGCLFTIAAGSAAADMATGKTLRDCLQVNQSSIMAYIEIPADHAHCAFHAALTLHRALRDYALKAGKGTVRKPRISMKP